MKTTMVAVVLMTAGLFSACSKSATVKGEGGAELTRAGGAGRKT